MRKFGDMIAMPVCVCVGSPNIYGNLEYTSSWSSPISLVCSVRYSPPSRIKWYRDGAVLPLNDSTTDMSVRVTDRAYYSSYNSYSYYRYSQNTYVSYEITLRVCAPPDDIVGSYQCRISNRIGSDSSQSYNIRGEVYTTRLKEC